MPPRNHKLPALLISHLARVKCPPTHLAARHRRPAPPQPQPRYTGGPCRGLLPLQTQAAASWGPGSSRLSGRRRWVGGGREARGGSTSRPVDEVEAAILEAPAANTTLIRPKDKAELLLRNEPHRSPVPCRCRCRCPAHRRRRRCCLLPRHCLLRPLPLLPPACPQSQCRPGGCG